MKKNYGILIVSLIALIGCGKDGANTNPTTASGVDKVFGQSWAFSGGEARTLPNGGGISIYLFNSPLHQPCEAFVGSESGLDFQIPSQTGDYDVSSSQSRVLEFTQTSPSSIQGESTDSGTVHISSISQGTIEGSVAATNESSSVHSTFSAKICP